MNEIERRLYRDHENFERLLHCFLLEVERYESGDAASVDLALILDALDYVKFYPERWHHPTEDLVFKRILAADPPEADFIRQVLLEHKQLAELTVYLAQLYNSVANGCVVPVSELTRTSREFIERQGNHIKRENEMVYPLMAKYLDSEDWCRVEEQMTVECDPLFDAPLRANYQNLYSRIVENKEGIDP